MNEERARDHSWAISPNYTEYVLSDIALWPARHLNLLGTRATWQRPFAIPQQVKRICSPHWLADKRLFSQPIPFIIRIVRYDKFNLSPLALQAERWPSG
jgi:hypothetical protein